jgi:hypothetical protein
VSRAIRKTSSLKRHKAASGQVVIEAIASIIIFTMMLALVMSISVYLYFQQALVTAAREGARHAALNADLGSASTQQDGMDTVEDFIADEVQQLTGQSYSPGVASIIVTPPSASADQTPGRRNVRVDITWNMTNPIGIAGFINALGGDGSAFDQIPVSATATMRYEE